MRILLFHKGGLGDVVFGLPLIADLRRAYPDAELCALTHDQGRDILSHCPAVDRVFSFGPLGTRWRLDAARAALDGRFDVALTTARSPRAGWLLWKLGAKTRVGFATGFERLFFTHRAKGDFEVVFSRRFQRLGEALGIAPGVARAPLRVSPEAQRAARARLALLGWDGVRPLVAVQLGGSWPTKGWPEAYVASFVETLWTRGEQPLLLGGDAHRIQALSVAARTPAVTTAGNAIGEVLAELSLCSAMLGIDSGISHAGAALGVPTLHLFGPNDPRSIEPAPHQRVLSAGLPCQPCNRKGKRRCPLGHHACMRQLDPERVAEALAALRGSADPGTSTRA